MLILLYGPDSYRRQQKLKSIIGEYKDKHSGFSVERFYLERRDEFPKLKDFSKNRSLFDAVKLGVISGLSNLEAKEKKELLAILKGNLENKDVVILIDEDKKPSKEFNFLLKKPTLFQEFKLLAGTQLRKFLQVTASERNLKLDRASQDLLVQVYEGNIWGLVTELDKLALLDKKEVTAELLKNHSDLSLLTNVYSVIHEIRNSRKVERRLSLLEQLSVRNIDSGMIFNILSSFIKDAAGKKEVANYDILVKSGKLEYPEALFSLVLY